MNGTTVTEKVTVYAIHYKIKQIADYMAAGQQVLLFIDEINRCEHAVQQELMNLILNREINGFNLGHSVHIVAAMNPTNSYDYQTVEMGRGPAEPFRVAPDGAGLYAVARLGGGSQIGTDGYGIHQYLSGIFAQDERRRYLRNTA